jgi:arginyl-tRNA synthetase
VRIKSILRKAAEKGIKPGAPPVPTERERALMLLAAKFPDAVRETYERCEPHHLCEFAYSLAQEFSRFYQNCHILHETDPKLQASWLALVQLCLKEFELLLAMLGIEIPEKM